jgi:hypothetical protein
MREGRGMMVPTGTEVFGILCSFFLKSGQYCALFWTCGHPSKMRRCPKKEDQLLYRKSCGDAVSSEITEQDLTQRNTSLSLRGKNGKGSLSERVCIYD